MTQMIHFLGRNKLMAHYHMKDEVILAPPRAHSAHDSVCGVSDCTARSG